MRALAINGVQLLDLIVADDAFVTELATVGCITWPQREHLVNIAQRRDRNDNLLKFLSRRSVADFLKFIDVLSKEQAHLVPLLVTDGGETFCGYLWAHILVDCVHLFNYENAYTLIWCRIGRKDCAGVNGNYLSALCCRYYSAVCTILHFTFFVHDGPLRKNDW